MLYRRPIGRRAFSWADVIILLSVGALILGMGMLTREWRSAFDPENRISLSFLALPRYVFFSATRGLFAYGISLVFTLVVGYAAARSKPAERIIIPLLDILQSIPVLGFLPGLVLGLIAVFPNSNIGLELAAILMIFTGQVWNMTFAFYSSLKGLPRQLSEASEMISLTRKQRFLRVELPYSAVPLAWNSLMSMAGGWFFLSVCEAFTLGDRQYRLPGLGAYTAEAIRAGNVPAMIAAIAAMVGLILALDFLLWRPVLVWVQRFRADETPGMSGVDSSHDSFIRLVFHDSRILRWIKWFWVRRLGRPSAFTVERIAQAGSLVSRGATRLAHQPVIYRSRGWIWKLTAAVGVALLVWACVRLVLYFRGLSLETWLGLAEASLLTFGRVMGAVFLASLWTVPVGVWLASDKRRLRRAQPVIQVVASFPAPMLYPLALHVFSALHLHIEVGSMLLMLLGVQWYVLFNVVAGATRVQQELSDVTRLSHLSVLTKWKHLFLPTLFPALVPGWVAATGGAWNASIVAEHMVYKGSVIQATGLGAVISAAASRGDFRVLMAGVAMMVVLVVTFNRTVWAWLFRTTQTRFRIGD